MSTSSAFFAANLDAEKNQVRLRFTGHLTGPVMRAAADELDALMKQVKPGFAVFGDFGEVTAMDLETVSHLTRIMDRCRANGVGLIVRRLPAPDGDIGIKLLGFVHYRGQVQTLTVDTIEEAERALG